MAKDILHARKRIAFGIAEDLESEFSLAADEQWDLDKAARTIEMGIPLSNAEAEAELSDLGVAQNGQPGISQFRRLRDALHCSGSIGEVIEAAIAKVAADDLLLASLEGLCGLAELRPGHLGDYKAAIADARAAIAKAKGEVANV